jgi:hypothetical protein
MGRMKSAVQRAKADKSQDVSTVPNVYLRVDLESRRAIDSIGAEWRMNMVQVVAALVERWKQSTDDERITAIRRPVAETLSA